MALTKDSRLTCLCGSISEPGSLLAGLAFPVDAELCHCNICRRSSGCLFTTTTALRDAPSAASLAHCTAYTSSARATRYFCSKCGCTCFVKRVDATDRCPWQAFSGIVELDVPGASKDVIKVIRQQHVEDTLDGTIAQRLWHIHRDADGLLSYRRSPSEAPMTKEEIFALSTPSTIATRSHVEIKCHCENIFFRLSRPDWTVLPSSSAYVPPPEHLDKCVANCCCCRSCRLGLGAASLQPWLYIPDKHILDLDGTPVQFSPEGTSLGSTQDYQSTPGKVIHSFCRTCGAVVFFWSKDRSYVVDVALGLVRSAEGSMAPDWISWYAGGRFSSMNEVIDQNLVDALLRTQTDEL